MSYKKVCLIGAGARGRIAYGDYILKNQEEMRYISVVEPDKDKRLKCAKDHNIDSKYIFDNEDDFFAMGKIGDAVLIANQDKDHYKSTMKALELGYDVLLEKPMSPSAKECVEMDEYAKKQGCKLMVCHVLRYTEFYETLKELLDDKVIGEIYGIDHVENIGNYHMAHSFVRGNWRNSEQTSPIVLSKTCHDMDIITWLVNSRCTSVYSKGSLNYFKKENAPKNSSNKCLECPLIDECRFSAKTVYLGDNIGTWPANTLTAIQTKEGIVDVLNNSHYGTCVYKIPDNNVCDHQVTILEFENGVKATFTLSAFTHNQYRNTIIYGSNGSISANTRDNEIIVRMHLYNESAAEKLIVLKPLKVSGGHGGGDTGLMHDFYQEIKGTGKSRTSSTKSMQSHIMSLAAEESRITNQAIDIEKFINKIRGDKQ